MEKKRKVILFQEVPHWEILRLTQKACKNLKSCKNLLLMYLQFDDMSRPSDILSLLVFSQI